MRRPRAKLINWFYCRGIIEKPLGRTSSRAKKRAKLRREEEKEEKEEEGSSLSLKSV